MARAMIFADGENLVFRYQHLLKEKKTPKTDTVHEADTFVWNPIVTSLLAGHASQIATAELVRTNYYPSVHGDPTLGKQNCPHLSVPTMCLAGRIFSRRNRPTRFYEERGLWEA
jgi:hypothetical protein